MDYVLAACCVIFGLVGIRDFRADWNRPPADPRYEPPSWWLWGRATWQATLRTQLVGTPMIIAGGVALIASGQLEAYALGTTVVFAGLCAMAMLFNWPTFLVYPGMREQRGLVQEVFRTLRGGR